MEDDPTQASTLFGLSGPTTVPVTFCLGATTVCGEATKVRQLEAWNKPMRLPLMDSPHAGLRGIGLVKGSGKRLIGTQRQPHRRMLLGISARVLRKFLLKLAC